MKIENRSIWLMALTVALSRLWELFYNGYEPVVKFWALFGFDITVKYDWFLFEEMEQYPHWYAQYTNYLGSICVLSYIIYLHAKKSINKPFLVASKVLLFFSIFRVISYWLFRGSIQFEILCTSLICFLLLIIPRCQR